MISCSHKKKVLQFLDQLCSLYENMLVQKSSGAGETTQAFIDKVCELAEENDLPSKAYRSLSENSDGEVKEQLHKVYCH